MLSTSESQTPRDRRNFRRIGLIQVVWLVCLVANGSTFTRHYSESVAAFVALLPMMVGALVVWSYVRFVRECDDLQKAIQLGGLAFGFGVCIVFTLAYPSLERLGFPHFESNHFAAVGVFAYFFSTLFYSNRYQ